MAQLRFAQTDWEFRIPFRIAYKTRTHNRAVTVDLRLGQVVGRGEAYGVSYRGETVESILDQLSDLQPDIQNGLDRIGLQARLPAGGARCAADCAFWDMEAKRSGMRAWQLSGMEAVEPLATMFTLGIDTPEVMAQAAENSSCYPILKIKLNGDKLDEERIRMIREARPDVKLVVDANQSWDETLLLTLCPSFAAMGVSLIEQPLPIGKDEVLSDYHSPVPLCADESCQTRASLPSLKGKYQYINIKLDKTGGLTEALALAAEAKQAGFGLMIGCMAGTSLAMAPAFIIGQQSEFVDLDGPLLLKHDVAAPIDYRGNVMLAPSRELWG